MKKLLIILGAIFFCIVMVIIIMSLVGAYYGPKLDKSSIEYVDKVVPIILASWNPQDLERRAHSEFIKSLPQGEPAILFRKLAELLGPFKAYEGAKGESHINFSFAQGGLKIGINATYFARAVFQKDSAEIKIDLNQDGEWKITGFFVKLLSAPTT